MGSGEGGGIRIFMELLFLVQWLSTIEGPYLSISHQKNARPWLLSTSSILDVHRKTGLLIFVHTLYPISRYWNWVNNKVGSERATADSDFYRSRSVDTPDRD